MLGFLLWLKISQSENVLKKGDNFLLERDSIPAFLLMYGRWGGTIEKAKSSKNAQKK